MENSGGNEYPIQIDNKVEGPQLKVEVHISKKDYLKQWGYPSTNWVYEQIEKQLPEGVLKDAIGAVMNENTAQQERARANPGKIFPDDIITQEAAFFAFRGVRRRSDNLPTDDHPNATLESVGENLFTLGIEAPGPQVARNLNAGKIWEMYTFPNPDDMEKWGTDVAEIFVYKNEPYILPPKPGDTKVLYFQPRGQNTKFRWLEISPEEAKAKNYSTLRDNFIGQIEIHFDKGPERKWQIPQIFKRKPAENKPQVQAVPEPTPMTPPVPESPQTGEIESTPLSFTREDLDKVLDNPDHTPEDIIKLLEPDFHNEFDTLVGVWKGFTLREHTLAVMKQFRKYFYGKQMPEGIGNRFMEFILALHDIGKPDAIKSGDVFKQHEFTTKILKSTLTSLKFTPQQINLASALIDGDPIGTYLQYDEPKSAEKVVEMSRKSGLPLKIFWEILKIYYQSDAGSYTLDAGRTSLTDRHFVFDHKNGRMNFSPETGKKINELEKNIFR